MLHDFSSYIIQFSDGFGIRWHGLSYLLSIIFSYIFLYWFAERQRNGINTSLLLNFIIYNTFGIFIGARLGYCLFYSPDLLLKFKYDFPYWAVASLDVGGMSSHGGIVGAVLASILFAYQFNLNTLYLFDLVSLTTPIGIFFGRFANFFNGEFLGRPCDSLWPMGVKFPQEIINWPKSDFDQLNKLKDFADKIGVTGEQWNQLLENSKQSLDSQGQLTEVLYKIIGFIQSGTEAVKDQAYGYLTLRHPFSIYAAIAEGFLLFIILFFFWRKPRAPGFISAMFIVFFSVFRFIIEFFREPDLTIGYDLFGLTRGQVLSVSFFIGGLIILFFWGRGGMPIPGWGRGQHVRINRR